MAPSSPSPPVPQPPSRGTQDRPLALAEERGGRGSGSAPGTHLPVLRKPIVPAHKGPGREYSRQLLPRNFQGLMVLCSIALKRDPKGLAPAKGLADPGGPLPSPPEPPPRAPAEVWASAPPPSSGRWHSPAPQHGRPPAAPTRPRPCRPPRCHGRHSGPSEPSG